MVHKPSPGFIVTKHVKVSFRSIECTILQADEVLEDSKKYVKRNELTKMTTLWFAGNASQDEKREKNLLVVVLESRYS